MTALVLAGGKSQRLGRDKAQERIAGQTLLERAVEACRALAEDIVVVVGSEQQRARVPKHLPVRVALDAAPGLGPLSGLQAGLLAARTAYAWAVACDMPFIDPSLLRYEMRQADGHDAVVPMVRGRAQTLHAVYSRAIRPVLADVMASRDPSLRGLLARISVRYVEEGEAQGPARWRLSCLNVNSAEELEQARLVAANLLAAAS